jgi:hypothetical protein
MKLLAEALGDAKGRRGTARGEGLSQGKVGTVNEGGAFSELLDLSESSENLVRVSAHKPPQLAEKVCEFLTKDVRYLASL